MDFDNMSAIADDKVKRRRSIQVKAAGEVCKHDRGHGREHEKEREARAVGASLD